MNQPIYKSIFDTAAQTPPPIKARPARVVSAIPANLGQAWRALLAKEQAKKSEDHKPRDMKRVAAMNKIEAELYTRRRGALMHIKAVGKCGTTDLVRLSKISESKTRHDADKLIEAGLIKVTRKGRFLVYQITPAGNAWIDAAGPDTPLKAADSGPIEFMGS